jgi:hypothetical protein
MLYECMTMIIFKAETISNSPKSQAPSNRRGIGNNKMLQNSAKAIISPGDLARTQSAPDRSESDGSSVSQHSFLRQVKYVLHLLVSWWDKTHHIHIFLLVHLKSWQTQLTPTPQQNLLSVGNNTNSNSHAIATVQSPPGGSWLMQ